MRNREKTLVFAGFFTLLFLLGTIPMGNVTYSGGPENTIDVIIMFKDGVDVNIRGAEILRQYTSLNGIAARIPVGIYEFLKSAWFVSAIQPDVEMHILEDTLDWGVDDVDAEVVWGGSENAVNVLPGRISGNGVKVAILDTGIDYTHPDLSANYKGGYDFVSNDNDPKDGHGHGTHCAGIVAAADNGQGVIGVAPKASIYAVRVLNDQGSGSTSGIIAGIDWAVNNGMDIISMSLGGGSYDSAFNEAINRAYNAGIVVVAASGNDGKGTISYPAKYQNAIAVGATDSNRNLASFSNYGAEQEVVAPGVNIYSTTPTYTVTINYYGYSKNYATMSGTSMATPMVAGMVALILEKNPNLTPPEVRNILHTTSIDLGAPGWDQYFGYGLINAPAAVEAAGGGTPTDNPPTCTIVSPTNGATVSGTKRVLISATDDHGISKVEVRIDSGTWVDVTANFDGTNYFYDWATTQYSDGPHTVSARATDTASQTSTSSVSVTVSNGGGSPTTMHVAAIDMWYVARTIFFFFKVYDVYTKITVHDGNGVALGGVTVYLDMTLPSGSHATGSGTTGSDGTVTIVYKNGGRGTYTSTVTNLVKTDYTYVPSDNIVTSKTITV
ncbi:MAG: S8 family serine peptidase [Candidatus Thorarchaeota archaeon]